MPYDRRVNDGVAMLHRALTIYCKFGATTGYEHPHLQAALENYSKLLQAMGMSDAEVHERLNDLLGEYGLSLG